MRRACELFAKRGHRGGRRLPMSVCLIYHRRMAGLQVLDRRDGGVGGVGLRRDRARVGPRAPGGLHRRPARAHGRGCARRRCSRRSQRWRTANSRTHVGTPAFLWVRALAIEAFYSDFVAPGVDATGAWEEIDFNTPLATRLAKDWSYLGISDERAVRRRRGRLRRGRRRGRGRARRARPERAAARDAARTGRRPTSRAGRRRRRTSSGGRFASR